MTGALTWGSDTIQWGGVDLNWGDEPVAETTPVVSGGAGQTTGSVRGTWRQQYDHLPKYTGSWERYEDFSDLDERDRLYRARDEEDAILAMTEFSGFGYEAEQAIRASWLRAVRAGGEPFTRASLLAIHGRKSVDSDLLPVEEGI